MTTCPKCKYKRTSSDDPNISEAVCPHCGIVYAKFKNGESEKIRKIKQISAKKVDKKKQKEKNRTIILNIKKFLIGAFIFLISIYVLVLAIIFFGWSVLFLLVIVAVFISKWLRGSRNKSREKLSHLLLQIDYIDAYGEKTCRQVDVTRIKLTPYHNYFYGYCHLREDERQFRSDRVLSCVDLETGEVIDDIDPFLIGKSGDV